MIYNKTIKKRKKQDKEIHGNADKVIDCIKFRGGFIMKCEKYLTKLVKKK